MVPENKHSEGHGNSHTDFCSTEFESKYSWLWYRKPRMKREKCPEFSLGGMTDDLAIVHQKFSTYKILKCNWYILKSQNNVNAYG